MYIVEVCLSIHKFLEKGKKTMNHNNKKEKLILMRKLNMLILFLFSIRIFSFPNCIVMLWLTLFGLFYYRERKKKIFDEMAFLLLLGMFFHGILYRAGGEHLKFVKMVEIVVLPFLFYIFGKQMVDLAGRGKIQESNVKKILLIVSSGMFLLNLLEFYSFSNGSLIAPKIAQDFWTGRELYTTEFSFLAVFLVPLLFYTILFFREKTYVKIVLLLEIVVVNWMNIKLDNRMALSITIALLVINMLIFVYINKGNLKKMRNFLMVFVGLCILAILCLVLNVGGIKESTYYQNFISRDGGILKNVRFQIFISVIFQMPQHLLGGSKMDIAPFSHAHNFWLQMYNDTGILSFICIVTFTVLSLINVFKLIGNQKISQELKYLLPSIYFGIACYLMMEVGGRGIPDFFVFFTFISGMINQMLTSTKKRKST